MRVLVAGASAESSVNPGVATGVSVSSPCQGRGDCASGLDRLFDLFHVAPNVTFHVHAWRSQMVSCLQAYSCW